MDAIGIQRRIRAGRYPWCIVLVTTAFVMGCSSEAWNESNGGAAGSGGTPAWGGFGGTEDRAQRIPEAGRANVLVDQDTLAIGAPINAIACTQPSSCQSGFCVDGVCCDTACNNTCMACTAAKKGSGVDGVCGLIASGSDPDNECYAGACSGSGTCKSYNGVACTATSQCLSNYCVDGVCCGNACTGACMACTVAKKGSGSNGACGSIANATDPDNECNPGECNGAGACNQAPVLLANGAACTAAAQCTSGFCVDGVCCDVACSGTCQACSATKKGSGTNGACGNIKSDTDPDNECAAGACSGSGTCKSYNGVACTATSQCLSNYCVDGVCCGNICNGLCMACTTAKKGSGSNGVCGAVANTTDPDNECSLGECNGSGACNQAPVLLSNGSACTSASQCLSGFCADAVCCDAACTGSCQACTATKKGSGTNGTCGNIKSDTDPDNECAAGACSGSGTCRFYNGASCTTSPQCLSNYCVDGVCCGNVCSGTCMACTAAKKGSGSDGACGTIANNADPDNECGLACNGTGACIKGPNGSSCLNAADCQSGFCADGTCCNRACSGACETCDEPASLGTCTTSVTGTCAWPCAGTPGMPSAPYAPLGLAGQSMHSLIAPDLNQDAKPDLVSADFGNGGISVLLRQPDGSFAARVQYATGSQPRSVTSADVNGDAILDVVVVNYGSNTVSVLLGLGDGSFQPKVDYATGSGPHSVTAVDFNADGLRDLAIANLNSHTVSVLLNQGNGAFAAKVDYPAGNRPVTVHAADLNADGKGDIAVVSIDDSTIAVLLNQGSGTFAARVNYPTGAKPEWMAMADFNADGRMDFATANSGGSHGVSVLLGQANGTLGAKTDYSLSLLPQFTTAADMDGDGKPDLAVAGSDYWTWYRNLGNGALQAMTTQRAWDGANSLAIADFGSTSAPDVAIGGNTIIDGFLNAGGGAFTLGTGPAPIDLAVGTTPQPVVTADFNLDGKPDLAVCNTGSGTVSVLRNLGNGQFATKVDYAAAAIWEVDTGDINGDGKVDLVTIQQTGIGVLLNQGSGTFGTKVDYAVPQPPVHMLVADLNGDARDDVVVYTWVDSEPFLMEQRPSDNNVRVYLGQANGSLVYAGLHGLGGIYGYAGTGVAGQPLALGDVDNDGDLDLFVVMAESRFIRLVLNDGTGRFTTPSNFSVTYPNSVATGDMNNDGKVDVVFGYGSTGEVFLNQGNTTFVSAGPTELNVELFGTVLADMNGDGLRDLVYNDRYKSRVTIVRNTGNGILGNALTYHAGGNTPTSIAVADFNLDAKPDLALSNRDSNNVTVLLQSSCQP